MSWIVTLLLLLIGLALIVKSGDAFVDAASWMAQKSGIPKFIIGATVVSLATTLPEMLVSFMAAGEGKVDMAIGNAVGSVTANIGLIMGIALVCMPTVIRRGDYMLRSLLMLGAAAVVMIFGFTGHMGILPGIVLALIFIAALADNIFKARRSMHGGALEAVDLGAPLAAVHDASVALIQNSPATLAQPLSAEGVLAIPAAVAKASGKEIALNIVKFALGAAGIVFGAQLLIDNGSDLALLLGVPERVVAVSVIAIGTSLPELVTTITAIAKKQSALSIGNIIGANIIDITLILPICALISGQALPVASQAMTVDIPTALIVGILAMVPTLITGKFTRLQGALLIVFYLAYLVFTTVFLA